MNNGIKMIFTFVLGAAAGSVVAWKLLEKRYADIAQEEIDSVKEVYSKKYEARDEKEEPMNSPYPYDEEQEADDEKLRAIAKNIISEHYGDLEDLEKGGSKPMKNDDIKIISPGEFSNIDEDEYDIKTLTYYADGVLTDEYGEIVEDVDGTVGPDALNSFGDYEDDSVFVLNEQYAVAYEILSDESCYGAPNPTDDE